MGALLLVVAGCGSGARGSEGPGRCFAGARGRVWLAPTPIGGGLVEFRVRDRNEPLAGATLVMTAPTAPGRTSVFTDAGGAAMLGGLVTGAYRVDVYHQASHVSFLPIRVTPGYVTVVDVAMDGTQECPPLIL